MFLRTSEGGFPFVNLTIALTCFAIVGALTGRSGKTEVSRSPALCGRCWYDGSPRLGPGDTVVVRGNSSGRRGITEIYDRKGAEHLFGWVMTEHHVFNTNNATLDAQFNQCALNADGPVICGESWIEFTFPPGRLYIHGTCDRDGPDT